MKPPKRILVVDHYRALREVVSDLLVNDGYLVTLAKDAAEMRAALDDSGIDLIVLDATMSAAEDVTLAVVARDHGVRLVMISGRPERMRSLRTVPTSFSGSLLREMRLSELWTTPLRAAPLVSA